MESRLARRSRLSPVVEPLEDRRLLSQFGPPSGWGDSGREMTARGLSATPIWGPMDSVGRDPGPIWSDRDFGRGPGPSEGPDGSYAPMFTPRDGSWSSFSEGPAGNGPVGSPMTFANVQGASTPLMGQASLQDLAAEEVASAAMSQAAVAPSPARGFTPEVAPTSIVSDVFRELAGGPTPAPAAVVSPLSASRGASLEPTAHLAADFAPISHAGGAGAVDSSPAGRPAADESPLAVAISPPAGPDVVPDVSARGPAAIGPLNGRISLDGQARPGLDLGSSKGADPRAVADSGGGIEGAGGEPGVGADGLASPPTQVPDPHLADMIMSFLPFDRPAMDDAVDQLFEPFDGLAWSVPSLRGPMGLVAASLTAAVSVLAVEVAIRLRRSREEELGAAGPGGPPPFPGLPGL